MENNKQEMKQNTDEKREDFGESNGAPLSPAPLIKKPLYAESVFPPAVSFEMQKKEREPFTATKADGWFAVCSFVLGFLFIRWAMNWQGWGVTLFTVIFSAAVLLYARGKGIQPAKASWYWLGILLLTGFSFSLWTMGSMTPWQFMLLFASAVYWCGSLFGTLLKEKTSNYLPLDAVNLLFQIPFKNFGLAFKGCEIFVKPKEKNTKRNNLKIKKILYLLLGIALCIPLLAVLMPLLREADNGNFSSLLRQLSQILRALDIRLWGTLVWQLALAFPVALYIFGLVGGNAHRRYTSGADLKQVEQTQQAMRRLPHITTITVLLVVSGLYILFVACQIPYFFSAFTGERPAGYTVYSSYARSGFFELCRVAALNLGLLVVCNSFCAVKRINSKILRALNLLLCGLTLLLIATAFSKMVLYMGAYGLSALRVQTSVFMGFLALLCIGGIFLQFRTFSIVRFAAVCGSAVLCVLCLIGLDASIASYNADAYISGKLGDFDDSVLWQAGENGVSAGMKVAENTTDESLIQEIHIYLKCNQKAAKALRGSVADTLSAAYVRAQIQRENG